MTIMFGIEFSANNWGTVAEWAGAVGAILVGLLAAYFAFRAWEESKRANAAEASLIQMQEAALGRDVNLAAKLWVGAEGIRITLSLLEGSPRIWIHQAEPVVAVFYKKETIESGHGRLSPDEEALGQAAVEYALGQFTGGTLMTVSSPAVGLSWWGDSSLEDRPRGWARLTLKVEYRLHEHVDAQTHVSPILEATVDYQDPPSLPWSFI